MTSARLNQQNQRLFALLKANRNVTVTRDQILSATGWRESTWHTHWSKGVYAPFLREKTKGEYLVTLIEDVDEAAFQRRITQNHQARELGANCDNPLARALLRKSKDNMTLALELYNRPSLDNRLDGFCVLFCMAWEQLLKAEIVEAEGTESIYRPTKVGKRRETISLEDALSQRLKENDPVRRNVALIAEFRHEATHLLMREVHGIMSRVFQAGVLNFAKRFRLFANEPLFPNTVTGLLSLVSDFEAVPDVLSLRQMYGEMVGDEILELVNRIKGEIEEQADIQFAIPIEYKLVLTKKEAHGDIKLVPGEDAPMEARIIERTVPLEKRFPYKAKDAATEVASRIQKEFKPHHFLVIVFVEKWRNSNNEFHHYLEHPVEYHLYSEKAVEHCVDKLQSDPDYLNRALSSHKASQMKEGRRRKTQANPRGHDSPSTTAE